jgi:hypothetical protein
MTKENKRERKKRKGRTDPSKARVARQQREIHIGEDPRLSDGRVETLELSQHLLRPLSFLRRSKNALRDILVVLHSVDLVVVLFEAGDDDPVGKGGEGGTAEVGAV